MNAIERESTKAHMIIAANALGQLLSLFPKMAQKFCDLIHYIYTNFKDLAVLVFMAIGFLVFLLAAIHYTENEYHIKTRLSRFLESSTVVKEF